MKITAITIVLLVNLDKMGNGVAQLVEMSLQTTEIPGSNSVIRKKNMF